MKAIRDWTSVMIDVISSSQFKYCTASMSDGAVSIRVFYVWLKGNWPNECKFLIQFQQIQSSCYDKNWMVPFCYIRDSLFIAREPCTSAFQLQMKDITNGLRGEG